MTDSVVTSKAVVDKLASLNVQFEEYEHEELLTCDDFGKANLPPEVSICKNMLLKDKKNRVILVTALQQTKVDLKLLSARLGLGKSGLRMAPDEMLGTVLQVAAGSVTPFAVWQPAAAGVLLLLDEKLRGAGPLALHPLTNTRTVAVPASGLEAFLRSIGREPVYVDLEADPVIDKDNAPDLKHHVDGVEPYGGDAAGAAAPPAPRADKAQKKAKGSSAKEPSGASPPPGSGSAASVPRLVQECLAMVADVLGAGDIPDSARRSLESDLAVKLNSLKNASYTSGFRAARGGMAEHCR